MPRHLIVTCGTSQIEKEERLLRRIELDANTIEEIERIKDANGAIRSGQDLKDLAAKEREAVTALTSNLAKRWFELPTVVGSKNNSFGAEVSTLERMRGESYFTPSEDSIIILSTATEKGAFSAIALRELLIHPDAWNMNGRVEVKLVRGLREGIENTEEVEERLCSDILGSMKRDAENLSVVTGGYKSLIPFFTIMALLEKLPMHYLFEGEGKLRTFSLDSLPLEHREQFQTETRSRLISIFNNNPSAKGSMVLSLKASIGARLDDPRM